MERFTPTHLTPDATPVQVVTWDEDRHEGVLRTRTGREMIRHERDLLELGSAEAQEILAEVTGQDTAQAEADASQDRVTLANWTRCVSNARDTLASGIQKALGMDLRWDVRKALQEAMAAAQEDLADFGR